MLTFFRRLINSKVGIIVTFVVLGVIALAFAAGDVTGLRHSGAGGPTDSVATVADTKIATLDLRTRAQREMENFRQQQPSLDMVQFIAGGGLDGSLDRMIDAIAFEKFGHDQGLIVSDKSVDGQIASIPQLQGPDGKFSQQLFDRLLTEQRMTYAQVKSELSRETMSRSLAAPTSSGANVPVNLALPYASLLLEKRSGQIAIVPIQAAGDGAAPTDAEITTYYQHNLARYTLAERRVIRYATVTPDAVKAQATPTDAEVAKAYQDQRANFAPTEKRTLAQVVVADQATATALAAKVKAGTPIEAAARAIGLEPATLKSVDKATYAAQGSPELANAVFGATKGSVVGPLRSALGFTVARVDAIENIPGKSLDQAKPEIVKALTTQKTAAALEDLRSALDDAISSKKSTFDEVVSDKKLTARVTPPLLASGVNPTDPTQKPDPALTQVVAAAFGADKGDSPQLAPVGQDGSFAVVTLGSIVSAAPQPLAAIRDTVVRDFRMDRAQRAARQIAAGITALVNKGTPLAQAMAAAKVPLPPARPLTVSRQQIPANARGAEPVVLMFTMAEHSAKLLEAPNKGGWFVVSLDKIERGDASKRPDIVANTSTDLARVIVSEYAQQFSKAVRGVVGVKKNDASIKQLKAELLGQGGSDQP